MNVRKNIPEFSHMNRAVEYAVDRLVSDGNAMTTVTYSSPQTLVELSSEVHSRVNSLPTKHLLRNHGEGEEDGWVNVQRMTFLGPNNAETVGQKIASIILPANKWVPRMHQFGYNLQSRITASGKAFGVSTLADWSPNRYGINVLNGAPGLPAIVAPHTDVSTEHGVVVVLEIPEDNFSTERVIFGSGNLSFIFGRDTCDQAGIAQRVHSVESETRRLSITFADLRPSLGV